MAEVVQLHATRGGELVTMIQREVPDTGMTTAFLQQLRDEIMPHVEAKGGCDELVLHMKESPGFLWAEGTG